jgi:hypothetical protein
MQRCRGYLREVLLPRHGKELEALRIGPGDIFAWRIALLTFQAGWIIGCCLPRFSGRVDDAVIGEEMASQAILSVALTLH